MKGTSMSIQPYGRWWRAEHNLRVRGLRDLTCMGFFLFYISIVLQPYIIIHIKMKQRATFASGLRDDEVIEGHIVRQNQVLLDIHQVAD